VVSKLVSNTSIYVDPFLLTFQDWWSIIYTNWVIL